MCVCVCVRACTSVCVCVCVYVCCLCMYCLLCSFVCVCVYMFIFVCMCIVCMHVYFCMWVYDSRFVSVYTHNLCTWTMLCMYIQHTYTVAYRGFNKGGCLMICARKFGGHAHFCWPHPPFSRVLGCALLRIAHAFHSSPLKNHENRSGEQLLMN